MDDLFSQLLVGLDDDDRRQLAAALERQLTAPPGRRTQAARSGQRHVVRSGASGAD